MKRKWLNKLEKMHALLAKQRKDEPNLSWICRGNCLDCSLWKEGSADGKRARGVVNLHSGCCRVTSARLGADIDGLVAGLNNTTNRSLSPLPLRPPNAHQVAQNYSCGILHFLHSGFFMTVNQWRSCLASALVCLGKRCWFASVLPWLPARALFIKPEKVFLLFSGLLFLFRSNICSLLSCVLFILFGTLFRRVMN